MSNEQVAAVMQAIAPWIPGSEWRMVRDILEGVDLPEDQPKSNIPKVYVEKKRPEGFFSRFLGDDRGL